MDVLRPCDPLSPMRPMPKIHLGWAPPTVTGKGPNTTASSRQRVVHAPRLKWYPSTTCTRPPFLPSKTTDVQCRAVDRHIQVTLTPLARAPASRWRVVTTTGTRERAKCSRTRTAGSRRPPVCPCPSAAKKGRAQSCFSRRSPRRCAAKADGDDGRGRYRGAAQ